MREDGSFVRLYPINFRDLPYTRQYHKYQWIDISATPYGRRDIRKESYRPDCSTIQPLGEYIQTGPGGDWSARAQFALAQKSRSMEDLYEQQQRDNTSLGVFKPKSIRDLIITGDDPDWKPSFKAALAQARIWDERVKTKTPPRKVPYKFHYLFECEDERCKKNHRMMIEDWEVGALYWRVIDEGAAPAEAAGAVRGKFLHELCGPDKDTYFFVGTLANHPKSWVVVGLFYPKVGTLTLPNITQLPLL